MFYKSIILPFYCTLLKKGYKKKIVKDVLEYYLTETNFRNAYECSKKLGIDETFSQIVKDYLYKERKLGKYYFEDKVSPQKYMQNTIFKEYKDLNKNSNILEVGPGDNSLFDDKIYVNWKGIDYNFNGESIQFQHLNWAKNKYSIENMYKGSYDNLSEVLPNMIGSFDLVCGSHSFEHTWKPIKSLKEVSKMLKTGGQLVLFVPDGLSDDIGSKDDTHTLYIVPGMMEEFFEYAGGFKDISIKTFRPNTDLVVTAKKI